MVTFIKCVQYYEILPSMIICTIITYVYPLKRQLKLKDVTEVSIPKRNVDSSGK